MRVYITTTNYLNNLFFIFGLNEKSVPVYICVNQHQSYIHIKSNLDTDDRVLLKAEIDEILSLIKDKIELTDEELENEKVFKKRISIVSGNTCSEFINKKFTYYKIKTIKHTDNVVLKTILSVKYQIPEMCEMPIKFYNDLGLSTCQWIEINTNLARVENFIETNSLRNPIQMIIPSSAISSSDYQGLPPSLSVVTIDAEMYSTRYGVNDSKAHPDALIDGDIIYCYSMVFSCTGSKDVEKSFCLFVGKPDENIKVDNGEIIFVDNEEDLFVQFSEIIKLYDPDVISGYNIQGFDFEYMKNRSPLLNLPNFGRLSSFRIANFGLNVDENQKFSSKSWEGAGGTHHGYTTPDCYGRVIVDVFNLVKPIKVSKGAPDALQSLKLNDVGKFLVNETKEDISYGETYLGYRSKEPEILSRIISYCIQDSVLCWKILSKVKGDVYLREAATMFMQDMNDVLITGQNKKIFNNFLHKSEINNSFFHKNPRTREFKVKGGHVEEPVTGKKTNVICLDFASMYPSAQMAMNLCLSTHSPLPPEGLTEDQYRKFEIDVEIEDIDLPADSNEFLIEFDVSKLNDDNYVDNFMKERKISPRYKIAFQNAVRSKEGLETVATTRKLVAYFAKDNVRKGIFPMILEELSKKRSYYKKLMKEEEKNSALYEIYDQRQKLVKVVMNSIYGVLGSSKGPLSCIETSSTITYYGRQSIAKVRNHLVEKNCKIIYGDTDSVMFQCPGVEDENFNCEVSKDAIEFAKNITDEINDTLEKPMKVEFEKIMNMVAVKKKHYLGVMTWPYREVFIKGLAGIRGDSTPYAQNMFRVVVRMITENKSEEEIRTFIKEEKHKLLNNQIPNDSLVVSAMLAATYKNETAPMKIYSDYLKSVGYNAEPGTKIAFLVVKPKEPKSRKSECFRPENTKEELDYNHYLERALRPIDEIMVASFSQK